MECFDHRNAESTSRFEHPLRRWMGADYIGTIRSEPLATLVR